MMSRRYNRLCLPALLLLAGGGIGSAQESALKPQLTPISEVVAAANDCLKSTSRGDVNLEILQGAGWKVRLSTGNPSEIVFTIYNKPGSTADIMLTKVSGTPGIYQCHAIGRFPSPGSFSELDTALKASFGKAADQSEVGSDGEGRKVETSFWKLLDNEVRLQRFYGQASVMITTHHRD
jgi:hypothetical protein